MFYTIYDSKKIKVSKLIESIQNMWKSVSLKDPKRLEEIRAANYEFVTKTASRLNNLKGYTTAYSNPRSGTMIVDFEGQNFIVTALPVEDLGEPLNNVVRKYHDLFEYAEV